MAKFFMNLLKLVVGFWVAKKLVLDNELISGVTGKLKDFVKDTLDIK